jgi:hypothetical protein
MLPGSIASIRRFWPYSLLLIIVVVSADAQIDSAQISGVVKDRSGRYIDGASVDLVDLDRGLHRRTQTNAGGFYIFPEVRPGNYRMQASAPGFQSMAVPNIEIVIQDNLDVHFTMIAGSSLDSITLETHGSPVGTSGTVGTVVEPSLVGELPLNGRSFQTLFQLTPGIVITPTSFASQGQFSANGQRTNANYFLVDGVSANFGIAAGVNPGQSAGGSLPALNAFGATNSLVSTDDVQEFAILTSTYAPEFGRTPGAQVSIVTRSGTNEFHGHVFDYLRNDLLDANDWFANRDGLKRPELRQNDYGGVLGFPITRDKTFVFASYEGLRLRQPTSLETDVPSLAVRSAAPASIRPFLDAYPHPTGPEEGNGLARAVYGFSNPSSLDTVSFRIDHHAGQALSLFGRYNQSASDRSQRGAAVNSLSTVTNTRFSLQTLTIGATYFATPHIIDDLRVNWSEFSASGEDRLDNFGGAIPLPPQLLFPSSFGPQNSLFQFLAALGPKNLRLSFGRNVRNLESQVNLINNVSYQIHSHLLKTGLDARRLSPKIRPAIYEQSAEFVDLRSTLAGKSFLTATAGSVSVDAGFANYSAYVQDTWTPYARVSVSYGLHWDYSPAPDGHAPNGLHPFAVQGISNLPTLKLASPETPLYHATSNNFAPRIGLAYVLRQSPGSESIIKAGMGMFYDLGNGPAGSAFGTNFPFSVQKLFFDTNFPLSPLDASPPMRTTAPPFRTIVAFPAVLKLPYTWHWNVGVQQSLGNAQSLSVSYIGASGHSLIRTEQYLGGVAGVPQAFTQLVFANNSGYSAYNALQIQFRYQGTKDTHILAGYTVSHALDNISTDSTFMSIPARFLQRRSDYGPSDFDIRHSFTLGVDYNLRIRPIPHISTGILSGWSFDPVVMIRSAPPVNVQYSSSMGLGSYDFRPDVMPGGPLYVGDPSVPGGRRINLSAFTIPASPRQGNLGRNSFRGFPLYQIDLAVRRRFRVTERINLQLRVEGFNLFNHPNFSPPASQLGALTSNGNFSPQSGFGISPTTLAQGLQAASLGSGFNPLFQIGGARSLQLGAKVQF